MPASTKWAVSIALVLIALAIGGGAIWQRQHPGASLPAELAVLLPRLSGSIVPGADPAPSPAAPPRDAAVAPRARDLPDRQASGAAAPSAKPSDGPTPPQATPPRFDIVRVEPKGDTLVAGTGAPNAKIAVLAGGKVLAEGKTDANGQFVLLPPPLPPGAYALTLRQGAEADGTATPGNQEPRVESAQSVAVSVPKTRDGQVVVALAEPGRPTKLLSAPQPPAARTANASPETTSPETASPESTPKAGAGNEPVEPPTAKPDIAAAAPQRLGIRSVELENGNGFYASGIAKPGTPVHVYLNQTHLADVVAGRDGAWSVTIRKGLAGGHYVVRADAGPGPGVTARVEVPFDVPAAMAQAATIVSPGDSRAPRLASLAPPRASADAAQAHASAERAKITPGLGAPTGATPTIGESSSNPSGTVPNPDVSQAPGQTPAPATQTRASAVIEEVQTRQVQGGDNLWKISRERLGYGRRFTQIYAANADQIRDPSLIYPGQIFVLPGK